MRPGQPSCAICEHLLLGAFARLPSCWTRQAAHAPRACHQKAPFDPERGLAPSCDVTKAAGAVAALPTAKNQFQQLHGPVISAAAARPRAPDTGLKPDAIGAPRRTRSTRQKQVRRRAVPNAIAAAPHQANPSAAAHRWRGPGDHSDSADQRQIPSTARACGPPARSSAGPARSPRLDTSKQKVISSIYPEPRGHRIVGRIAPLPPRRAPATSTRRQSL